MDLPSASVLFSFAVAVTQFFTGLAQYWQYEERWIEALKGFPGLIYSKVADEAIT